MLSAATQRPTLQNAACFQRVLADVKLVSSPIHQRFHTYQRPPGFVFHTPSEYTGFRCAARTCSSSFTVPRNCSARDTPAGSRSLDFSFFVYLSCSDPSIGGSRSILVDTPLQSRRHLSAVQQLGLV